MARSMAVEESRAVIDLELMPGSSRRKLPILRVLAVSAAALSVPSQVGTAGLSIGLGTVRKIRQIRK